MLLFCYVFPLNTELNLYLGSVMCTLQHRIAVSYYHLGTAFGDLLQIGFLGVASLYQ